MANGLLDYLSGFGTTPPEYMGGLLGQEAIDKLKGRAATTGIANAVLGYLAAPKNQNLGLGRIIGQSLQAGMTGAQGVYDTALQDWQTQQKITEMQRQQKLQAAQDAFRAGIGQPNATREVMMQPTEQVPVAPIAGAEAPNFQTQLPAPVVTEEKYYDPNKMIEEGLKSGALDIKDYLTYATKAKAGTEILTPDTVKSMNLPTNRGQVYQRDLTTNKIDLIEGTLAPEAKSTVEILTPVQAKALNLPTGRGQVYQKDKLTNKIDLIEGTVAPASADGTDGSVDFLNPQSQAMLAQLYLKTGTLPPLGGGKNAALAKANILNMAALMSTGKSPEAAADLVMNNKQNMSARIAAIKAFNTGIEGRSARSLNTVMYHLDTLDQAGQALNNGDVRLFNSIGNKINKEIGVAAPTDFDATKKIVSSEIIKAITGTGGALTDREEAQQTLDAANSPAQLAGVIKQYKELFAGQLIGLENSYVASTNRPASEFRTRLDARTRKLLPPLEAPTSAAPTANQQFKDEKGTYIWEYSPDQTKRRKKYV
jgi:hypothetical protein